MHYLLSTFGSSGDVFPMLGLSLELRSRGHDVTFATNAHYAKLSQRHGIPFEPLGTEDDFETIIRHPDLWHPQRAFKLIIDLVKPALRRQYDMLAEYSAARDTIAISNVFGFGALLAREKLNVPVYTIHFQPSVMWSDYEPPVIAGMLGPRWLKSLMYRFGERFFIDPVVCPFLNEWRAELGLPPVRQISRWWNSPDGVICLFPDWFAAPQPDWPLPLMQTDFPLWNDGGDERLSENVESFLHQGEPPLIFTPGSTNVHAAKFFEAGADACRILGKRGILLTEFPEQIPSQLPPGVVHIPYVPLNLLLPKCAAFIYHGGIGSASQAMAAGIPHLVMPLAHDQFDNAARLQRLGVGDSLGVNKFTAARVEEKLRRLLQSPQVAAACRSVAEKLAARNGIARTADAILDRSPNRVAISRR